MLGEQLSFFDPNYFHESHPFDLRFNLESDSFLENVDPAFPINRIQPIITAHQPSCRQQALEHILENISQQDLPGEQYVAYCMRHKYRRNCKSSTLRQAATSLIQFLSLR